MKNIKIILWLLIIFIMPKNVYLQDYKLVEVGKSIKFGNKLGELGKNLQPQNDITVGFIPGDIEIDIDDNFYIYDNFSKRIIKYDKELNFINEININFENLKNTFNPPYEGLPPSYSVDLETDIYGNLYALIGQYNYYYGMVKYNKIGERINDFNIEEPPQKLEIGKLRIYKDKMHITTGIPLSLDKWYLEFMKNNVFVYDLNGKFLGRCDFYFEDYESYIYKSRYKRDHITAQEDILYMEQYTPSTSIKPTSELELKSILSTKLPYNTSLSYLGSDKFNNLYFTEKNPFIMRVFNFKYQTVKEIITEKDFYAIDDLMEKFNVIIPHTPSPFIVSYAGDVYIYGIKVNKNNVEWSTECESTEVELSIMKIKFTEEIK